MVQLSETDFECFFCLFVFFNDSLFSLLDFFFLASKLHLATFSFEARDILQVSLRFLDYNLKNVFKRGKDCPGAVCDHLTSLCRI